MVKSKKIGFEFEQGPLDTSEWYSKYYLHASNSDHWDNESDSDSVRIDKICEGFSRKDFEENKESVWFDLGVESICKGDESFLEIGCGMGRIAKWVSPFVGRYVGMDISNSMVEAAIKYNSEIGTKNCKFIQGGNLSALPKEERFFDIIFSELVAIHLHKSEVYDYINRSYEILNSGGRFFFQLPYVGYPNSISLKDLYSNTVIEKFESFKAHEPSNDPDNPYLVWTIVLGK